MSQERETDTLMAAPENSFSIEDDSRSTTTTKPPCNPLCVPVFLVVVLYGQLLHGLCALLLLLGIRVSPSVTGDHTLRMMATTFATTAGSHPVIDDTKGPAVFLRNHRSWGDFVLDSALLGAPSFVSRWLVALGIPMTSAWGYLHGWVWFFQRGTKHAEGTVAWTASFWDNKYHAYPEKGVVLYPEGTRNLEPQGMPLKPGGLVSIFRLGWPVQIVITSNKEWLVSEKFCYVGCGTCCVTSVSAPLYPSQTETAEAFIERVKSVWSATWKDAYGSEGLPRVSPRLPGAQTAPISFSCRGSPQLLIARSMLALLLVYFAFLR